MFRGDCTKPMSPPLTVKQKWAKAAPVPGEGLVCAWVPFTSPRPAPSPEHTNCNTQKQTPPPHHARCQLSRNVLWPAGAQESEQGSSPAGNLPLTVSYVMFFHQVPLIRILWGKVSYQQSLVHTWKRSWCPLVDCKDLLHRNPEGRMQMK